MIYIYICIYMLAFGGILMVNVTIDGIHGSYGLSAKRTVFVMLEIQRCPRRNEESTLIWSVCYDRRPCLVKVFTETIPKPKKMTLQMSGTSNLSEMVCNSVGFSCIVHSHSRLENCQDSSIFDEV